MANIFKSAQTSGLKKPLPILASCTHTLCNKTLCDFLQNPHDIACGIFKAYKKIEPLAATSIMDLSAEAKTFGAKVTAPKNSAPKVLQAIADSLDSARALKVPDPANSQTSIYINSVKEFVSIASPCPILACLSGPLTLASLLGGTKDTDVVKILLEKSTEFLINYAAEFKRAGASGIFIAEPMSAVLTHGQYVDFSVKFINKISQAVRDENFAIVYHNCADNAAENLCDILKIEADTYHFGNSCDIVKILEKTPQDKFVAGNLDPQIFCKNTPDEVANLTLLALQKTANFDNFFISSGCEIPPNADWQNIQAFAQASKKFYL